MINILIKTNLNMYCILGESYLDLSSILIKIELSIVKENGEAYIHTDLNQPSLPSLVLPSLFSSIQASFNSVQVANVEHYPYLSFFKTYLSSSYEMSRNVLSTQGFFEDQLGKFENPADNSSYKTRQSLAKNSSIMQFVGRLHWDFESISRYLLSGIDLDITMQLSKPSFFVYDAHSVANKMPTFKIHSASLICKRLTIAPEILAAHSLMLEKNIRAKYSYCSGNIKTFALSSGARSFNVESIFNGQLPNVLVVAFVESASFLGEYGKNIYNFQSFNIQQLKLYVNNILLRPINVDCDKRQTADCYYSLLNSLNVHNSADGILLTEQGLRNGLFFCGWSLAASTTRELTNNRNLNHTGNIRLEIVMGETLDRNVTMLVYSERFAQMALDRFRNVEFIF